MKFVIAQHRNLIGEGAKNYRGTSVLTIKVGRNTERSLFAVKDVEYRTDLSIQKVKSFTTIDGVKIDADNFKSISVQSYVFAFDNIDDALKALVRYPDKYENNVIITKHPGVFIGKGGSIIKKISKLGGKTIKVEKRN